MEFRKMRRHRQSLSEEECREILIKGGRGTLAVTGDGGWPYAVPLNYVYNDGVIYFHCAKEGHKLDAIKKDSRVCFSVVSEDEVVPEKLLTMYKSVTVFGHARVLDDEEEIWASAFALGVKYAPMLSSEAINAEIERERPRLAVIALTPEHITGKQALEFVKKEK
ncbi:MAG: pyridoxamine 5'-phosphate oxidase family protein [Oscillospiraceae bacterium]|nr:pyridoxamine 5'-phosphate oxidase family protein [Oscillospiraceae bacterium]